MKCKKLMRLVLFSKLFLINWFQVYGIDYTGIYSYNKGLNKANGVIYVTQINSDTAFFYLHALSGMPEFNSTDIKGFIRLDSNIGYFKDVESCRLVLEFEKSKCLIKQDTLCKYEFNTSGMYKKTSNIVKRNATMMLNYTEKPARTTLDTLTAYVAPHAASNSKLLVCKDGDIKVIDEYNQFLLIEHKKHKQEFLWVYKKHILLPKLK